MIKVNEGSIGHWAIRLLWVAAVVFIVVYIPTMTKTSTIGDFTLAFEYAIAAMSLNLAFGYAGIISLGHSAFFGMGMYTTAILVTRYGWSQGWTFFAAAAITFVIGALIALPALRLKGVYLAVVTLALGVLFPTLVRWDKLEWLSQGPKGIDGVTYSKIPKWPILGELRGREGRAVFIYWLAVVLLVICYLVARGVVKSRVGRSLIAIRDNETAAAVMGIPRARTKTLVFGLSAAMCAIAGSLSTMRLNLASPDIRNITLIGSITFLLIMVLGGAATLWGPIVGAVAYVMIDARTRAAGETGGGVVGRVFNDWLNIEGSPATLILAISLLAMMFIAPFGIVGLLRRIARRFVVIVPRPAGNPIDERPALMTTEAAADVDGDGDGDEPGPDPNIFDADPSTTSGETT